MRSVQSHPQLTLRALLLTHEVQGGDGLVPDRLNFVAEIIVYVQVTALLLLEFDVCGAGW